MRELDRLALLISNGREGQVGAGQDLKDLAWRTGDIAELRHDPFNLGRADMRTLRGELLQGIGVQL